MKRQTALQITSFLAITGACLPAAAQTASPTVALPEVDVVAITPLGGSGVERSKVPYNVETLSREEFEQTHQNEITEALARRLPGISTNDVIGSPLVQELDYRGFVASPIPGTPQGLAVYQNGVRINEAWGDGVNWDAIPSIAIDRTTIESGNPIFGLNALGGAVILDMKNGFTYQGTMFDGRFGSRMRRQAEFEYGKTLDNWGLYFAAESLHDNGYRYFGGTHVNRGYADLGYRAEGNELHLAFTGGRTNLGVAGTTPEELVDLNPSAVFTTPQTTQNTVGMVQLNGKFDVTNTLTVNTVGYLRSFDQAHVDGNISNFVSCGGATLCDGNGNATSIPDVTGGTQLVGEDDDNWTRSRSVGATVQLTDTDKIIGHDNKFTFGVSYDHGWTNFKGSSYIGILGPNYVVTNLQPTPINEPASDVSPTNLNAQNGYLGVYVLDAFDVTRELTVTVGARYNNAQIDLADQSGQSPSLTSTNNFQHINPGAGATYKITPNVSAYASWSEANRTPTPLELGCANPNQPCMIDNFLVSDPPLKQVISQTVEAGFKGNFDVAEVVPGRLEWSAGIFRTMSDNDILSVPSQVTGFGFFQNAGTTRRQGVETSLNYRAEKWNAYINYTYLDATFRTPVSLSSPNNPFADANGNIQVMPGDSLPGVPRNRLKFGVDYSITPEWKVGGDFVYESSRYFFGDQINALSPLPGYETVNLRSSYQVTKNVQVYGLVENAFNQRYATYGALFESDSTINPNTGVAFPGFSTFTNPKAVTVAPPIGVYIGLKATL